MPLLFLSTTEEWSCSLVGLFVCWFMCAQDNSKRCGPIQIRFSMLAGIDQVLISQIWNTPPWETTLMCQNSVIPLPVIPVSDQIWHGNILMEHILLVDQSFRSIRWGAKLLSFNGHLPRGPGLAGTRMSPFWILLELRTMEVVVVTTGAIRCAKLKAFCHHQQTNTQVFIAQPAVSEHWREGWGACKWPHANAHNVCYRNWSEAHF